MIPIKCSYTELVPIHKIQEHPKNPHKHSPEQIERLAKLIDFQGIRHPIIISKRSGFVIAGHGRLMALKKLNVEKVPVDYQDFKNEAQEYSFIVSDNAIGKDEWAILDLGDINQAILDHNIDLDIDMLGIKSFNLKLDAETNNENNQNTDDPESEFEHECPSCGFQF